MFYDTAGTCYLQSRFFMRRVHGRRQPEHKGQQWKQCAARCQRLADTTDEKRFERDDQKLEERIVAE